MVNIITILVDVIARKTKCNSHSIKNYLFNRKKLKKKPDLLLIKCKQTRFTAYHGKSRLF